MQDGTNLNEISCHTVVHTEWEAADQGATQCPMDEAVCERHVGDIGECSSQLDLQLASQPCPLLLIPRKSLRDIRRGFRPELYSVFHDRLSRSLPRTCSQFSPGPGAGLSSRRSSSSLCQSGTGTFSGVAARLSQISSTSLRRSLGGSCRISSRKALLLGAMIQSCEMWLFFNTPAPADLTDLAQPAAPPVNVHKHNSTTDGGRRQLQARVRRQPVGRGVG